MKYHVGDRFLLSGIECKVAIIDVHGNAHLVPEADSEGPEYNNEKLYIGCVFAVVNPRGRDKLGNKVVTINNTECGAV